MAETQLACELPGRIRLLSYPGITQVVLTSDLSLVRRIKGRIEAIFLGPRHLYLFSWGYETINENTLLTNNLINSSDVAFRITCAFASAFIDVILYVPPFL